MKRPTISPRSPETGIASIRVAWGPLTQKRILFLLLMGLSAMTLKATEVKVNPLLLEQMFPYSLTTIESGSPQVTTTGKNPSSRKGLVGQTIPMGSVVEAPADGVVQLQLACGSTIRLAAKARIRIENNAIILEKGATLIRHVGSYFPMKMTGAATLLISRDSVMEAERENDTIFVRVQVGTVRSPAMGKPVVAGESITASGRTADYTDLPRPPRSWEISGLLTLERTGPLPDVLSEETDIEPDKPAPQTKAVEKPLIPGQPPSEDDVAPDPGSTPQSLDTPKFPMNSDGQSESGSPKTDNVDKVLGF